MKFIETGRKITELITGKKVEGTVAAVLPTRRNQARYVVDTKEGYLIVEHPIVRNISSIVPLPSLYEEEFSRDQKINKRFPKVTPWVDGQIV